MLVQRQRNLLESFNYSGSFFQKEIATRVGYASLLGGEPVACVLEVIVGIGAYIGAIFTLGTSRSLNKFVADRVSKVGRVHTSIFQNMICLMNPGAVVDVHDVRPRELLIIILGEDLAVDASFAEVHLEGRLVAIAKIIGSVIMMAIFAVIGSFAAVGSLVTGGKYKEINTVMIVTLETQGELIATVMLLVLALINPKFKIPRD